MTETMIGKVSDFFKRPVVAGVEVTSPIKLGDCIHIKGHTTDLRSTVESLQIDNRDVQVCNEGDSCGVKVPDRVRKDDKVYKCA